jgi:PD-(D/E)XK nuclease superfamily
VSAPTSGGGRPSSYKTADGKRVPGVTTILSRFKESGGLIHWAWNLGMQQIDYKTARDDAGSVGSYAHSLIDDHIHDRPAGAPPESLTENMAASARSALAAFQEWSTQVGLRILDTERALISEKFRFGGTYDAIGEANGKLILLDWKTSNRIYPEYVCQLGAYRQLLRETSDGKPTPDAACLLRVGKEMGDFHYHSFPAQVLDLGWEAFEKMRALYDIDAQLKKVVG